MVMEKVNKKLVADSDIVQQNLNMPMRSRLYS